MPRNLTYQVVLDEKLFSIAAPVEPDKKFLEHKRSISLHDSKLFTGPGVGVQVLSLNWTYRKGFLFKTVSGVLDMQATVVAAGRNVSINDQLGQEILHAFRADPVVAEIGYADKAISFKEVDISGRRWLMYVYPLGGLHYAAVLSEDRYLVVSFDLIKNLGGNSWKKEARELMIKMVASMRLEQT